jgi:hypothetical protein
LYSKVNEPQQITPDRADATTGLRCRGMGCHRSFAAGERGMAGNRLPLCEVLAKRMNLDAQTRFEMKFAACPMSGCWIWLTGCDERGYGRSCLHRKNMAAHRVAWMIYRGPIGDKHVCHQCDVRCCVNPAHLFLGTHTDNMRDCLSKGRNYARTHPERFPRGERHWKSTLTAEQVLEIRRRYARGERPYEIAQSLNLVAQNVANVTSRRLWRDAKYIPKD